MREAEDQLKVIPQFCFPDAKDWVPVDNFPRSVQAALLLQHLRHKKVKENRNVGISQRGGNSSAVFLANNHLEKLKVQKSDVLVKMTILPLKIRSWQSQRIKGTVGEFSSFHLVHYCKISLSFFAVGGKLAVLLNTSVLTSQGLHCSEK